MATQDVDRPQGKKRTSIFSCKRRTITIILGLIFAVAGLIFWINGINNDNTHVDKIMGALFTFLLLVCAFLTVPFLISSEETPTSAAALSQIPQPAPSPQVQQIQFNPTFNINQTNAQQPNGSTIPIANTEGSNMPTGPIADPNKNPQAQQQSSSGDAPGPIQSSFLNPNPVPSLSINEDQASEVDEGELLDGLIACSPGAFSRIVACIDLPPSWRPSDKADPAEKATNLIDWAKHPKGPGIEALNTCYEQTLGIAKKK